MPPQCCVSRRALCSSCGARRMAETAAHLVDNVIPDVPIRQLTPGMACSRTMQEQLSRVLSLPIPLRYLLASHPEMMGPVLEVVNRAISSFLINKAGFTRRDAKSGAVTMMMCMDVRMPRAQGCA